MAKWQAECPDGWTSKTYMADDVDEAANMAEAELRLHVVKTHNMELSSDPVKMHKEVVDHMKQLK